MNLIQVQERLKDMPIQSVISYANGMNPEVPPYLALGELNRRKRDQQAMQPVKLPQGTVKENLEEANVANAQDEILGQMMAGAEPYSEESEMAEGGVTTLTVPDNQFEFASGGIISFSDRGVVPPVENTEELDDPETARLKKAQRSRNLLSAIVDEEAKGPASVIPDRGRGRDLTPEQLRALTGVAQLIPSMVARQAASEMPPAPAVQQPPPAQIPGPAQGIAAPAAPRIPIIPMPPQGIAQQALQTQLQTLQNPALPKSPDDIRKAMMMNDPTAAKYLNQLPGEIFEKYLAMTEKQSEEDKKRFEEMQKSRAMTGIARALIAGGEASRGQRGLGASMAGYGRVAADEVEAARTREENFIKTQRELQLTRMKMIQEIQNARIAHFEGRVKEASEHEKNVAELKQKAQQLATSIMIQQASAESSKELQQTKAQQDAVIEEAKLKQRQSEVGANRSVEQRIMEELANPSTTPERRAFLLDNLKKLKEASGGASSERDLTGRINAIRGLIQSVDTKIKNVQENFSITQMERQKQKQQLEQERQGYENELNALLRGSGIGGITPNIAPNIRPNIQPPGGAGSGQTVIPFSALGGGR